MRISHSRNYHQKNLQRFIHSLYPIVRPQRRGCIYRKLVMLHDSNLTRTFDPTIIHSPVISTWVQYVQNNAFLKSRRSNSLLRWWLLQGADLKMPWPHNFSSYHIPFESPSRVLRKWSASCTMEINTWANDNVSLSGMHPTPTLTEFIKIRRQFQRFSRRKDISRTQSRNAGEFLTISSAELSFTPISVPTAWMVSCWYQQSHTEHSSSRMNHLSFSDDLSPGFSCRWRNSIDRLLCVFLSRWCV